MLPQFVFKLCQNVTFFSVNFYMMFVSLFNIHFMLN